MAASVEDVDPVVEVTREDDEPIASWIELEVVGDAGVERLEIPTIDRLDLDEEQLLYDVAGVIQPDFMGAHPQAPEDVKNAIELLAAARTRNPKLKRALVMIAVRRAHPEIEFDDLYTLAGKVDAFDVELAIYGKSEQTENPR